MSDHHRKPIEVFTSLDLEMNQTETDHKIIQIGACAGNIVTGEILGKISLFVNPNEQLTQYIVNLTGIKQSDVDNGLTLPQAYEVLKTFHKQHDSFVNVVTWGGGDSQELLMQLKRENPDIELDWCFGRRWIDVKTLFVAWRLANKQSIQGGLAKCMLKVGLRFQGRKHNGLDDSVNTFHMYRKMLTMLEDDLPI